MAELTVASTTDTQQEINKAAGITAKAEEVERPAPPPEEPQRDSDEQPEQEQPERKPGESKSAYQKRIDTLTRRIAELEKQIHRVPEPQTVQAQPEPVPSAADLLGSYATWLDSFDPQDWLNKWAEKNPNKPWERGLLALNDYQDGKRTEFKQQAAAQAEAAEKANSNQQAFNKRIEVAKKKYEDWDEVMSVDTPIYNGVMKVISKLDNGPDVAYFLQTHRDVVDELNAMDEELAMAEVGSISKLLGPKEETEPTSAPEPVEHRASPTPRRAVSAAPLPISPVGGSATKSSVNADELPYQEYKRVREKQLKNKYR